MIEARALSQHYKEVRERLRNPPNAVPDTGINLPRSESAPRTESPSPIAKKFHQIDSPSYIPFRLQGLTFCSTLEFAAKEYGLSFKEIRAHSRCYRLSRPRQIAIYLAAK